MQRLDTLKFALAGGIYGAGYVALATICALLGAPGFEPFTDLLVRALGSTPQGRPWRVALEEL